MVFSDGGNSSKTLEFLLFCNGTLPVSNDNRDTKQGEDKTMQSVATTDNVIGEIETATDAIRTPYGNLTGNPVLL